MKIWLKESIDWLHKDGSKEILQHSNHKLIELMNEDKDKNLTVRVWDRIDELEKLTLHLTNTYEQGEIYILCAKMAADLENIKDASRLFQAAESKYKSYPHQRAVALWMLGCLYWVTSQTVDAISSWQDAISLFEERSNSVQVSQTMINWYADKIKKLSDYLDLALTHEELPTYAQNPINPAANHAKPAASAPEPEPDSDPNPDPDPVPEAEDLDSLRWLSCFVSDSVPAGGFGPTGYDPDPVGYLEISEVQIQDQAYEIHSTKTKSIKRNTVNIVSLTEYQTVRVTGTSMNVAKPVPIEDGDYILVHRQSNPNDSEIVVAGIIGEDNLATVKRLKYRNGKIQLLPESTDESHYNHPNYEKEWTPNEIRIIGVVEAVFKKK
ncbi:MAG: S24 family peptidase [Chloroflexota bacterium]